MSIRPMFDSERLLEGFDGQPPFKACGISAGVTGTNLATTNEASIIRGWPMGKALRTARLKTGWRAFEKVHDSNGIPDTDDAIRIHRAMFPTLPDPIQVQTRDRKLVRHHLDEGNALSMAFRLSALPARSGWRQYTSADHQMTMWDLVNAKVTRQDPMHPHSDKYRGERLSLDEGLDAAEAIENGLILYWLYPIGRWTQARLRTLELQEDNQNLAAKVATLKIALGNRPPADETLLAKMKNARDDIIRAQNVLNQAQTTLLT